MTNSTMKGHPLALRLPSDTHECHRNFFSFKAKKLSAVLSSHLKYYRRMHAMVYHALVSIDQGRWKRIGAGMNQKRVTMGEELTGMYTRIAL